MIKYIEYFINIISILKNNSLQIGERVEVWALFFPLKSIKLSFIFCLTRFRGAHITFETKLHVSLYDVSFNIAERGVSSKSPVYLFYLNFMKIPYLIMSYCLFKNFTGNIMNARLKLKLAIRVPFLEHQTWRKVKHNRWCWTVGESHFTAKKTEWKWGLRDTPASPS